jgi:hypothetical protein
MEADITIRISGVMSVEGDAIFAEGGVFLLSSGAIASVTGAVPAGVDVSIDGVIGSTMAPYSGISPCFFMGRSSRLLCRMSKAMASCRRVSAGSMMSSISRRAAAAYGVANVDW